MKALKKGVKVFCLAVYQTGPNQGIDVRRDYFIRPLWSFCRFRRLFIIPFTDVAVYVNTGRIWPSNGG